MDDPQRPLLDDIERGTLSRRQLLRTLGVAALSAPIARAVAQGRCMRTFGIPACDTMPINPVFEPTGWRTTSLDHITMLVADYQKGYSITVAPLATAGRMSCPGQTPCTGIQVCGWAAVYERRPA